jgi:RimJ/RimL family protein N-acetyltransferase
MTLPEFTTERIILRGPTEKDAPALQKYFADYRVIGELSTVVPWPYPESGSLDFIRSDVTPNQGRDRWVWSLFLKNAPDEAVGNIDL